MDTDNENGCRNCPKTQSTIERLQEVLNKEMRRGEFSSYVFAAISDGDVISTGIVCVQDHIKMIGLLEDNKARVMESRLKEHK